ncbi:MAG: efflux RND transporter periplasmic adaptor subunit [Desulfovibrio sp.]|nr:efflux RND transporter periplasmic adaptor subunit [Desulfovibrio sp.]
MTRSGASALAGARILLGLALFGLLAACGGGDGASPGIVQAPVRTARVEKGDMQRAIQAVGNVEASASVAITPRIKGEIIAVNFTEGEDVTAGESILEIDPRPYRAELDQQQANLAKSRAQLHKARVDRARFGKLVKDGYISKDAYEQSVTDAAVLEATVEADAAAANRAELELSYCSVIAPISGRIGELRLHKGNMVKDNDTGPVCSIDTIAPCYIAFSVPEAYLSAILDHLARGQVRITATPIGGSPSEGTLTLVGNQVDTKTGSIRLRGTFQNEDKRLWPGQFAEIALPLGYLRDTLIIPSQAVQTGRDQTFVYVVGPDNRAEYRKIRVLMEHDGHAAVEGELAPDEKVIVEGLVRITPGIQVRELD